MNNKNYIVAYTLFSNYFTRGFKTFYRHFNTKKGALFFANNSNIKDNCIVYESLEMSVDK